MGEIERLSKREGIAGGPLAVASVMRQEALDSSDDTPYLNGANVRQGSSRQPHMIKRVKLIHDGGEIGMTALQSRPGAVHGVGSLPHRRKIEEPKTTLPSPLPCEG